MERIIKKIRWTAKMSVLTGLHIGGSKDNVEIGGIDSPVIKMATKGDQPYIPGSSLKGKMRCLLEQVNGATSVGGCDTVNKLFGFSAKNLPSKLIVRDAYLTPESEAALKSCESLDMLYTESKYENNIDRIKGVAGSPRQTERVPAGAEFLVEMVNNVWDDDKEEDLIGLLEQGIKLIENDYLGGSGSRGYGQVVFGPSKKVELTADNNWNA